MTGFGTDDQILLNFILIALVLLMVAYVVASKVITAVSFAYNKWSTRLDHNPLRITPMAKKLSPRLATHRQAARFGNERSCKLPVECDWERYDEPAVLRRNPLFDAEGKMASVMEIASARADKVVQTTARKSKDFFKQVTSTPTPKLEPRF